MQAIYSMVAMVAMSAPANVGSEDYDIILADLQSLPSGVRLTTRYVSLAEVDDEDVVEARRAVSYLLNSVAALRSGNIARPKFLAGGRIARFQAEWYAPTAHGLESFLQEWERMAETNPYTCFETEVDVDGQLLILPVVGGWVSPDKARAVSELTGSICPMVHFGHFMASLNAGSYYRLAGVGNRDETLALVGIDIETVTNLHADRAATVKRSDVANAKPRRIRLFTGAFGTAWVTYDVAKVSAANDAVRHPLSRAIVDGVLTENVQYDANEYVIMGRNGLPVWLITSAEGIRQDVVSPEVAVDYSESHDTFDAQIRVPFSCIRCHARGGYNEYEDYQQTLMKRGQFAYDAHTATRIGETYRDDLAQARLDFDQSLIELSTKAACGTDWETLSMNMALMFRRYVLMDVTPKEAGRVMRADVATAVGEITTDPYLLALAAGESVNRAAWFSSVHLAFSNGVQPNEKPYYSGGRFHVSAEYPIGNGGVALPDADSPVVGVEPAVIGVEPTAVDANSG